MDDTANSATAIPVAFARVLRGAGVPTPVSAVVSFTEALGVVGLERRRDVYWAARATLVRRPEDIEPFDRAFGAFFDAIAPTAGDDDTPPPPLEITLEIDDDDGSDDQDDGERRTRRGVDDAALQRHRGAAPPRLRRLHRR